MDTLITWLGDNDLHALTGNPSQGQGAVADFLVVKDYSRVILLHNRRKEAAQYSRWLASRTNADIQLAEVRLSQPHDFDAVYDQARDAVLKAVLGRSNKASGDISYLLSSGTKAMSSALLLIGCSDLTGRIYFNWIDRDHADPKDRYIRVKWPERFSLSLFATRSQVSYDAGPLLDNEGRELSRSPAMKHVYERARRVAVTEYPVLIHGETGTGKEILAKYLVRESARSSNPLIPVNCGAIPESLVDSELFGYQKGAFSGAYSDTPGKFEAAHKGTIFLDEVGELPLSAQVRLLRFLQEGEINRVGAAIPRKVDVRVIAASHRNLKRMVQEGLFRSDLYFRLARYPLSLPPLRDRDVDLQLIGKEILKIDAAARGSETKVDDSAWKALGGYNWPGNIRELQNILTRCAIDAPETPRGRIITASLVRGALSEQGLESTFEASGNIDESADLPPSVKPTNLLDQIGPYLVNRVRNSGNTLQDILEVLEAEAIKEAIRQEKKQKDAGKLLGYSPQNLSNTKKRLKEKGHW